MARKISDADLLLFPALFELRNELKQSNLHHHILFWFGLLYAQPEEATNHLPIWPSRLSAARSPGSYYIQYLHLFVFHDIYIMMSVCVSQKMITSSWESPVTGPPLFGLYPNGLFTFGLSLIGLQGYLDYHHLDYL